MFGSSKFKTDKKSAATELDKTAEEWVKEECIYFLQLISRHTDSPFKLKFRLTSQAR